VPGALDPDDGGQQLLLGKMLLERGLITPDQLREALVERARSMAEGDKNTSPLGGILVRKGYLTDAQLLGLMAEQNGDAAAPTPPYEKTATIPAVSGPTLPAMTVPDPMASDGGRLGKYVLVRELGRGGMGVVYEAVDSQLNRKVALKLMLPNPNADPKERALEEERFVQEAQLSAKLKHPNIVTVYEAGLLDGRQFLSMEMIDGQAFNEWRKTVTIRQQIQTVADVASAVHHAHEQGILHRDLKPRNILVSSAGHPYVTDFGLAKSLGKNVHQSLTGSGAVVGTPAYMSPEQAQGLDRVDWRTDIYSLGVILYECMTGKTPFTGESPIEILMKVVKDPVVPPLQVVDAGNALGLDKGVENICLKALAKKDRDRYVTAQAFADDLTKWLAGEKVHVVIPKTPGKGNKKAYVIAAICLLALMGGLGVLGFRMSRPSVKPYLEMGARFISDENFTEALAQYRVALAYDPTNADAMAGVKSAQDGMARKEKTREDQLKAEVSKKFTESEQAQLKALELQRKEREAASEEQRKAIQKEREEAEEEARKKKAEADKAEEEFRRMQAYILPTPGTKVDAWKDAINLLPMIDPRRNAISGSWDNTPDGKLVSDRSPFARVEIPFTLPQEYDFQMLFERRTGAGGVTVILSKGGRQFRCEFGGDANSRSVFEVQASGKAVEIAAEKRAPVVMKNGDRMVATIQVRADGVTALLNNEPILKWTTDYRDLGLDPQWKLRNQLHLGVGSSESEVVFHTLALLEVSGRGRRQEWVQPPALKAQSISPASLKPGLVGEYYLGKSFDQLAMRRVDNTLDFHWGEKSPWVGGPTESYSVRWTGFLQVPRAGKYIFTATADDGVRLFIDDLQVLASWNSRTDAPRSIDVALEEGFHRIKVEYFQMAYTASMVLAWSTSPSAAAIPIAPKSYFHTTADFQSFLAPSKLPELLAALPPYKENVNCVAYDRSGKLFAVAGEDRRVRIFDSGTLKELGAAMMHPSGVLSVAFSPDGTMIATGARDSRVRLWELQNRTELRTLEGPGAFVECVAFSPDGKMLAAGSYDQTVRLWAVEGQDEGRVLTGHLKGINAVAFSKDGKTLASAGMDRLVKLWDVETAAEKRTIAGHADSVEAVLFTPGGRTLVTAGADGLIKMWDPETGAELKVLKNHGEDVMCLAFNSTGLILAAGSSDGMIKLWDAVEGRVLKVIPAHTARVCSLMFAPSGRPLASGGNDGAVRFWTVDR
jgi:WD40 repeat protein/predicted Ser/Thr protein kinase